MALHVRELVFNGKLKVHTFSVNLRFFFCHGCVSLGVQCHVLAVPSAGGSALGTWSHSGKESVAGSAAGAGSVALRSFVGEGGPSACRWCCSVQGCGQLENIYRDFHKWKTSFFCQRHALSTKFSIFVLTYRVTNFLPFSFAYRFCGQTEQPLLEIPI